jgi:hypothetical protein
MLILVSVYVDAVPDSFGTPPRSRREAPAPVGRRLLRAIDVLPGMLIL